MNTTNNNSAVTFTTRTAAVNWLVAQGKPANFAKAAVNEALNYDEDGATDDLIRQVHESDEFNEVVMLTEAEVLSHYNTMADMFAIVNNVIELDGQPLYDIEGSHLSYNS